MRIYSVNVEIAWYVNICATRLFYLYNERKRETTRRWTQRGVLVKGAGGTVEITDGVRGGRSSGGSLKGAAQPDTVIEQHR